MPRRGSASALALLAGCLLSLWATAPAPAATVRLGPDLNGLDTEFVSRYTCLIAGGCTFSQATPGYASPVSGAIVRWRVAGSTGQLTLRVLSGNTGGAIGPTETASTISLQEFPAAVLIRAGEQIALDMPKEGSELGLINETGTSIGYWQGALAAGETRAPTSTATEFQLLFNADVQPAPGISALAPTAGPVGSVTKVVISGHDFTGASAVRFGPTPAAGFTVDSDTQITASTPPSAAIASVPVSVTTVAGTTTSSQIFSYEGCRVPKLNGRKLKVAKKKLRAAGCRAGKLTKRGGATAKNGVVARQAPKPGTVVAPGSKVKLTIKP